MALLNPVFVTVVVRTHAVVMWVADAFVHIGAGTEERLRDVVLVADSSIRWIVALS